MRISGNVSDGCLLRVMLERGWGKVPQVGAEGTDCPIRLARNHNWEKKYISQKIGNKCYDLLNLVSFDYCGEY